MYFTKTGWTKTGRTKMNWTKSRSTNRAEDFFLLLWTNQISVWFIIKRKTVIPKNPLRLAWQVLSSAGATFTSLKLTKKLFIHIFDRSKIQRKMIFFRGGRKYSQHFLTWLVCIDMSRHYNPGKSIHYHIHFGYDSSLLLYKYNFNQSFDDIHLQVPVNCWSCSN